MRIYLDHNATTPMYDAVREAVSAALVERYGNASSVHAEGAAARAALERARGRVAALVGAHPAEIVFSAGATESNHMALHGLLGERSARPFALVSSSVEHPSVGEPLAALERQGVRVTRVPVDADGLLDLAAFEAALERGADLVSILWANNETGVMQPIERIAACARARGVRLHVDATQALGRLPVDLRALPIDLLSASAHKLNGPKGIGFLFVRRGVELEPWLRGGPQERRRRAGTENVPAAVGFGVACELAARELPQRAAQHARLRDRLLEGIEAKVPGVRRNGSAAQVLPNTLNLEFEGAAGDVLLAALDLEGIAVSSGAACASGSIEPSHVLLAMGRSAAQARSSLRFSVGHGVDEAQIDRVIALLPDLVARAREALRA